MGRITTRRPVTTIEIGAPTRRRADTLAVEEPLEIRLAGSPYVVTMRTPGHDLELAAGFLVSEGVVRQQQDVTGSIHCGGPGTSPAGQPNTLNVLDLALAPGITPEPGAARSFYSTSSCGVCGVASLEAVEKMSTFDLAEDDTRITPEQLAAQPDALRARQEAFERTGGLHAAGLFDAATGELLVVREDVGRHNAVDKVVGWAILEGRLPLRGTILQVSGRASFELVQKAAMAGIPVLAAVSAPSSLAVDLAVDRGMTLVGFLRGPRMNVYAGHDRVEQGSTTGGR